MSKRSQIWVLISLCIVTTVLIFTFEGRDTSENHRSASVIDLSNTSANSADHTSLQSAPGTPNPTNSLAPYDPNTQRPDTHGSITYGSITIDGYTAYLTETNPNISILILNSADLNNLHIEHALTSGFKLIMDTTELISGNTYSFSSTQNITLSKSDQSDSQSKDYQLAIFKVDHIVDTGLPTVIINTDNNKRVVDKVNQIDATMSIIDGSTADAHYGEGLYHGPLTIRGRGNSSWEMPKKSYKIAPPENEAFLDMPKEDDWVLMANYSDKSLMRNYIAYELARSLDMAYTPTMRFVELYLNGEHLGNYLLGEQIKIGKNRLNLNKLKNTDTTSPALTGGYIIEKDWLERIDINEDEYFTTSRINDRDIFAIKRPSAKHINPEQVAYIADYFQQAEDALFGADFEDPDVGYQHYFDIDSFVDWYIVNELFKNVDANFGTSVYLFKDLNDKIHFGPAWDFDLGAGNVNYSGADKARGFYVKYGPWISSLMQSPTLIEKLQERWAEIEDDQIPAMLTLIRNIEQRLEPSATENFNKWNILGTYTWPNPVGFEDRQTYRSEVDYLVDWLEQRIDWLNESIPKL